MPSWWSLDPNTLDILIKALSGAAPVLIGFLIWVANIGGLKTLNGWFSNLDQSTKESAIEQIKKGLNASQPGEDASECVNELVAGLDRWQLSRQRINGRIVGLRRSTWACMAFLASLLGGWVTSVASTSPGARSLEQALLLICLLALLLIMSYGFPLIRLVIENGIPGRDALAGKTNNIPSSNIVSATEAATSLSIKPASTNAPGEKARGTSRKSSPPKKLPPSAPDSSGAQAFSEASTGLPPQISLNPIQDVLAPTDVEKVAISGNTRKRKRA